jgi:hypothetical protein
MNRIYTMARFKEPDDKEPFYRKCDYCESQIIEGEDIFEDFDKHIFCCEECVFEYYGIRRSILEQE